MEKKKEKEREEDGVSETETRVRDVGKVLSEARISGCGPTKERFSVLFSHVSEHVGAAAVRPIVFILSYFLLASSTTSTATHKISHRQNISLPLIL